MNIQVNHVHIYILSGNHGNLAIVVEAQIPIEGKVRYPNIYS